MIKLIIPNKLGIEIHCNTSAEVVELLATLGNQPEDHRPHETAPRPARRKKTEGIKSTAAKKEKLQCALCPNPVRSDNKGCPNCHRRVCAKCRITTAGPRCSLCRECAGVVPTGRPKKDLPIQEGTGLKTGITCENYNKFKASVKCVGCAKMICGFCARRLKGQCIECADNP